MKDNKLIVGITQGDSNGIGYEVIIKALSDPRILDMFIPVVYGSSKIFSFYRKGIPEIEQMDTNAKILLTPAEFLCNQHLLFHCDKNRHNAISF